MNILQILKPTVLNYCIQRVVTWYPLRKLLTKMVVKFVPQYTKDFTARDLELSKVINEDGCVFLPNFLTPETVQAILRHLNGLSLYERFGSRRSGFDLETLPQNIHVAEYATADIVTCPEVISIANHHELIGAAAAYLGCKPTISNLNIWWSFPAAGLPQEAENYHRDVDDWRFVKFFVYLSDVDDSSGPHCFVTGSHKTSNFLKIRRISDSEVFRKFSRSSELKIGGKIGDGFLEDTFGLHKGQPPIGRNRLVLQVQYSIFPIGVYKYNPCPLRKGFDVDPYTNRLYFEIN